MKVFPEINSLENENVDSYPTRAFDGKIRIIYNTFNIEKVAEYLSTKPMLGFDTETRPSFSKNQVNSVALLQLSDENEAFLFRINKIGIPEAIQRILSDKNILKVGVAVHDDLKGLQKIAPFSPENFVDLQTIAKQLQINAMGLRTLTPLVMGFKISKRQQLSNWENRFLSKSQQLYAATDAWVSLKIYKKLQPYL
ncbi:MAG: 3'-5' exonuclease domain-containing protein 2 [Bacteroidales bacterium]|nr:3'-5' exonuclease domain-containing protein 2 [Bacteroidales bacterium]